MTRHQLKRLRRKAQLTQTEAGKRLGIRKNTVYRYESGLLAIPASIALLARLVLQPQPPE